MKTSENITKTFIIKAKVTKVTVKNIPVMNDWNQVETYRTTVTIKHEVEQLNPLDFKDADAIADFVGQIDFDDPNMKLDLDEQVEGKKSE